MKNFFTIVVVAMGFLLSGSAGAQMKIGYIKIDNMVALMPETAKLDSLLDRFQVDSLNPQYTYMVSEYQRKDSMYRDSLHTLPAIRKQIAEELP